MTDRARARHRASSRATTPLTTIGTGLTQAVGDHVEALGLGGAAIAVSSGLVASMTLPPDAAAQRPLDSGIALAGLSLPAFSLGAGASDVLANNLTNPVSTELGASLTTGATTLGAAPASRGGLLQAAPLTAPTEAEVDFDSGGLTASAPPASRAEVRTRRKVEEQRLKAAASVAVTPAAGTSTGTSTSTAAKSDSAATPAPSAPVGQGARGSAVVSLASRYIGLMYRYGGNTPSGFDCSGLVQYVYKQVGISLPRTANAQMNATTSIPASAAKAGDLVFFLSGGSAYHVGIVTGPGMMIDSPKPGKAVSQRAIFSGTTVYRRVTG